MMNLHWLPSFAPNPISIFTKGRLLLKTATSRGDNPSLFKLKIYTKGVNFTGKKYLKNLDSEYGVQN